MTAHIDLENLERVARAADLSMSRVMDSLEWSKNKQVFWDAFNPSVAMALIEELRELRAMQTRRCAIIEAADALEKAMGFCIGYVLNCPLEGSTDAFRAAHEALDIYRVARESGS